MPMPKHPEPLVTKAVSVTVRQWDALEERAREEQRSASHLVRKAIDDFLSEDAGRPLPERAEAEIAVAV